MAIGSHGVDQPGSGATIAARRPQITATTFSERLPRLLDNLRQLGFSVGVEQHVAVNELLIGLAARKAFPLHDETVFGRLLCSLFAKSPLQQEIFATCFENWLRMLPTTEPHKDDSYHLWLPWAEKGRSDLEYRKTESLGRPRLRDREDDSVILLRWQRYLGWFMLSLVTIGLLVGAIWGIGRFDYSGDGTTLRNIIAITTGGVSLILSLLIFLRHRMDIHLERKLAGELPDTTSIHVRFSTSQLFKSNSVAKTSYNLRLSRLVNQDRLDPEATIHASIRAGGFFVPVSLRHRVVPEYLVLIDRRTFADQSTALTEALLARLVKDGVTLSIYYFDRSARFCFPRTIRTEGVGRSVPIDDLADRHRDSRLLVFADPMHILHPGSTSPQSWIQRLAQWESPALFVRRSDETASVVHDVLRAIGFSVFRATEVGLRSYSDFINRQPEESVSETTIPKHRSLPDLLENESLWLGNREPDLFRIDSMLARVRSALGPTGSLCLSACAIYPEIKWQLTAYLVREICRIENFGEGSEEILSQMTLFPWFRHARMPDWLRVRLIADLEPRPAKTIRHLIESLFLSALESKVDSHSIFDIVREHPSVRSRVLKMLFRRASFSKASVGFPSSPLRERVFATFMESRLSFRLPRAVRHLVYARNLSTRSRGIPRFAHSSERLLGSAIKREGAAKQFHGKTSTSSDSGLLSNIGAGLCAIFPAIGGIIFYFIVSKGSLVRHWAVQSIYFGISSFAVLFVFAILAQIFAHIPRIGWIFAILIGLLQFGFYIAYLILWIFGIIKAFTGHRWEYPFFTRLAKKRFPSAPA